MVSPGPVTVQIADMVVARVAARRALAVPGVVALQADIGKAVLGMAGSMLGPMAQRPPAGASAEVRDGAVTVRLTVVTRLGYNCRDLAHAVQVDVADDVARYTGMRTVVTVTVADVLLEMRPEPDPT